MDNNRLQPCRRVVSNQTIPSQLRPEAVMEQRSSINKKPRITEEESETLLALVDHYPRRSIPQTIPDPTAFLPPHLYLPCLKDLHLSGCRIGSVQFLLKLSAPSLEQLDLSGNELVSVKALRKCVFPQLTRLDITNNPILEAGWLSELRFHSVRLHLFIDEHSDLKGLIEALSFVAKMEKRPVKLYCQSENRIRNKNVLKRLKKMRSQEEPPFKIYHYQHYGAM